MRENGTVKRTVAFTAGVLALGLAGYFGSYLRAQQAAPAHPTYAEPRTRIALINLAYVIKNYTKTKTFQDEIKGEFKTYETRAQVKQGQMEKLQKDAADPKTTPEQRENFQRDFLKLKREVEDITAESKSALGKKSDEQMVILYREIQDAAQRYAMAHNFDLVLHYIDATTQADYYAPASIVRKLQSPACMPLYTAPGLDISYEVLNALNASYRSNAAQNTPASAPPTSRPSGN
jgi:Skp family chaperone for outer membrane proteins